MRPVGFERDGRGGGCCRALLGITKLGDATRCSVRRGVESYCREVDVKIPEGKGGESYARKMGRREGGP